MRTRHPDLGATDFRATAPPAFVCGPGTKVRRVNAGRLEACAVHDQVGGRSNEPGHMEPMTMNRTFVDRIRDTGRDRKDRPADHAVRRAVRGRR